MEETQFWRLVGRYLAGDATAEEASQLEALIESDPEKRSLFDELAQAWTSGRDERSLSVDPVGAWYRLEARIQRDEAARGGSAVRKERADRPARRSRHPIRRRVTVGVVGLMLAGVLVFVFMPPGPTTISTDRGERLSVQLVDGSRVQLNSESILTLEDFSGDGPRQVRLQGEAFFEVAPDAARPFYVNTSEGRIRVIGTAFNVSAYAELRRVAISVEEGAVALIVKNDTDKTVQDTLVLRATHRAVMSQERVQEVDRGVDLEKALAWRVGQLVFEDADFADVVLRLERWYDLQIDVSQIDSVDRLNAVFDREPPIDVIGDIALALNINYALESKRVIFFKGERSPP